MTSLGANPSQSKVEGVTSFARTSFAQTQWELFLKHVVDDEPFRWTLLEGAKGVQLAEQGLASWQRRAWADIDPLA